MKKTYVYSNIRARIEGVRAAAQIAGQRIVVDLHGPSGASRTYVIVLESEEDAVYSIDDWGVHRESRLPLGDEFITIPQMIEMFQLVITGIDTDRIAHQYNLNYRTVIYIATMIAGKLTDFAKDKAARANNFQIDTRHFERSIHYTLEDLCRQRENWLGIMKNARDDLFELIETRDRTYEGFRSIA